jgi:hypothetical protein
VPDHNRPLKAFLVQNNNEMYENNFNAHHQFHHIPSNLIQHPNQQQQQYIVKPKVPQMSEVDRVKQELLAYKEEIEMLSRKRELQKKFKQQQQELNQKKIFSEPKSLDIQQQQQQSAASSSASSIKNKDADNFNEQLPTSTPPPPHLRINLANNNTNGLHESETASTTITTNGNHQLDSVPNDEKNVPSDLMDNVESLLNQFKIKDNDNKCNQQQQQQQQKQQIETTSPAK